MKEPVRWDERGASLIEFALVLPVLLMLLVGIVSTARAWNVRNTLEHAAREAARSGATVRPWDAAAVNEVRSVVDANLTMAGLDPTTVASCIDMGANPCNVDDGGLVAHDVVGVVLILPDLTLDFVLFARDVTMTSSAAARYES
ncbi:MAG: pilus assembly protein [Acidimicrobiia bacterium]|nr:pilus assembly protein [Acidimicrobiia bacterium]MDH4307327.1 pilus assembly protein [Acidimicrobiia bacterium]MDH5292109.1 pilus assembly protein [Acidimicrobiia bacterium]